MRAFSAIALAAAALAAAPEQIHVSYTPTNGVLAVDFVAADAAGTAYISLSAGGPWTAVPSTSFNFPTIGYMHQALLPFNITTPGKAGFYKVATASGTSTVFPVFPTPARNEVHAIFGDFGLENDECLSDLVAEAAKGTFDSVLHTGDWCVWRRGAVRRARRGSAWLGAARRGAARRGAELFSPLSAPHLRPSFPSAGRTTSRRATPRRATAS
jgi:hypothetical protein